MAAPLDALTALVMAAQADPTDEMRIQFVPGGRLRWHCMTHLEDIAHRKRHAKDLARFAPTDVCRMIANDDVVDNLRYGRWKLFQTSRGQPPNRNCTRCLAIDRAASRAPK